jgi:GTP-binding protein Era
MSDEEKATVEESQALIEEFLSESGEAPTEDESWFEEFPEGHRSGFVAIIGRPNVGKSTLANALVGEKVAIVSRKPQTTRTRILGILTQPDYQAIFMDTPGIHKTMHAKLNRVMLEHAVSAIPDADVLYFLVDLTSDPRPADHYAAALLREKSGDHPIFLVLNKLDLVTPDDVEERLPAYQALLPQSEATFQISALHGMHVASLLNATVAQLPDGPRYYPGDQVTDQSHYQIAAELIREGILKYTHQEVPHASAVLVEDFQERENGVTYISARIWVERDSQKGIVIGKGGKMLKRIGAAARKELERFVGSKVYLDLWVKAQPRWRDRDARLQELGYK